MSSAGSWSRVVVYVIPRRFFSLGLFAVDQPQPEPWMLIRGAEKVALKVPRSPYAAFSVLVSVGVYCFASSLFGDARTARIARD